MRPSAVPYRVVLLTVLLVFPAGLPAQDRSESAVLTALESAAANIANDRPREALKKLAEAETLESGNPWLWFYRGLAHLKLGNWYDAMDGFDRAQDLLTVYGQPDPTLSASIREYRHLARRQVFGLSFITGLAFDSNVTFLGAGGAGFEISGQEDSKFTSRFQVAYSPISDETHTLTINARIAHTWNFSVEQFNDQDYGLTIRYSRHLDDRWEAAIQYDYDVFYLGNQPFLSDHGLSPSLTYHWDAPAGRLAPTETVLQYRIDSRDYLFDTSPEFDRDGFANFVGLEQRFTMQPISGSDWTWDGSAGYSLSSIATEGSEFDRLDHTFFLGFGFPITNPWMPDRPCNMNVNASWLISDYRNASLIDGNGDERSDLITSIDAVISQELSRDSESGTLILHTILGWTDADSNVKTEDQGDPFTYDKWIVGFQLEWSW